jgi:uncharacterized protein (DUF58 family)
MQQILNKLNKIEIRIRKAVNSYTHGNFHSIFKGSGLEFADLRSYQYGDDIRTIDWNSTAKGHDTYVKIFKEEKEQTVFFMVDVSASQEIGLLTQQKIDRAKEIGGVLALSAMKEGSHIGLYCFSDQKETYIKPQKTKQQEDYRVISELFKLKPQSTKTDLSKALTFCMTMLKRRSVVILISDFIAKDYEHHLKAMSRKHDLVVIHLFDNREVELPRLGIIPIIDKETKLTKWVNTSSSFFRKNLKESFEQNRQRLEALCRQNNANYLSIESKEDYAQRLIQLFRMRRA